MLDYDGLGLRLPMVIVSPYAKRGHVSHVHSEHGSILRFIEDLFALDRLAARDARATSPEADAFDFRQPPRRFRVIQAPHGKEYFVRQPLETRWPDTE
jgi:phospholipase C